MEQVRNVTNQPQHPWYADLRGILEHTPAPKSKPLLPLFEAITNSLDALEHWQPLKPRIEVHILRDEHEMDLKEAASGRPTIASISSFRIEDNGIGFTDENCKSFRTFCSRHKAASGGKGVGRFLWLKAFDEVRISSIFQQCDGIFKREFIFSIEKALEPIPEPVMIKAEKPQTIVQLIGFKPEIRFYAPVTVQAIARRLVEHFLDYFAGGRMPECVVIDDDEEIDLLALFAAKFKKDSEALRFEIKGHEFELLLFKLYHGDVDTHRYHLIARGREVVEDRLKQFFPDLVERIGDDGDRFFLSAYISSKYFNERVNLQRMDFDFDDESQRNGVFADTILTKNEFFDGLRSHLYEKLKCYVEPLQEKKIEAIKRYIHTQAPRYLPLISGGDSEFGDLPPFSDEKKLDEVLSKKYFVRTQELRKKSESLLSQDVGCFRDPKYKDLLQKTLEGVNDFGRSQLAQYVVHRKIIVELLRKAIAKRADDSFVLEEYVHELVCPRYRSSEDIIPLETLNLWLIDERLAFHNYLGSEKEHRHLTPVDVDSRKRTDIFLLKAPLAFSDDPYPFHSVIIVEFKRPQRDNYTPNDNPIQQVTDFIDDFRKGAMKDYQGRQLPPNERRLYAYIIADETRSLIPFLDDDYETMDDGLGFFRYYNKRKAYVQVITFEKLLQDAEIRNKILFEKLGIQDWGL